MSKSGAVCCGTTQKSPYEDANESVGMGASTLAGASANVTASIGASVSASETNAMGNDIAEGIARREGPCSCTP